jgi:hypothetical protein
LYTGPIFEFDGIICLRKLIFRNLINEFLRILGIFLKTDLVNNKKNFEKWENYIGIF